MIKTLKIFYMVCFFSFNYNANALFETQRLALSNLGSSLKTSSVLSFSLSDNIEKISGKVNQLPENISKLSYKAVENAKKGREEAKGLVAFLNLLNNDFSFETAKKVLPDLRPIMPRVIQSLRLPDFVKSMLTSYFTSVSVENFSNNFFVKQLVSYVKKNQKQLFEAHISKIDIFAVSEHLSPVEKLTFFTQLPKIVSLGGRSLDKMYNLRNASLFSFEGVK
jgi:hypothetical protein